MAARAMEAGPPVAAACAAGLLASEYKAAQDPAPVPCRHSLPLRGMSAPLCA